MVVTLETATETARPAPPPFLPDFDEACGFCPPHPASIRAGARATAELINHERLNIQVLSGRVQPETRALAMQKIIRPCGRRTAWLYAATRKTPHSGIQVARRHVDNESVFSIKRYRRATKGAPRPFHLSRPFD